jgi:HTH-type transcriptional regulator/antitoxin MqsA
MGKTKARVCSNCEVGHLEKDVRDVEIIRQKRNAVVHRVHGFFCNSCDGIEFDDSTDSASRYAEIGDELVLANRADAAATLKAQRKKLKLTQLQASVLTGGGHNAFSRYENGIAPPMPAVMNLFKLLAKHPDMLRELES